MSINIVIDSSIRLNHKDLSKSVLDEIFNQLRIVNPQKRIAEREMLWNAEDVPSHIELWKYNGHNELILPRGFLFELVSIFTKNDLDCKFIGRSITEKIDHNIPQIDLRDYQRKAFHELMIYGCGIYKAPTGAGKTRVMLEVIRQAKQKTLVICEKSDIVQQWYKHSNMFGFNAGLASGRNFDDNRDLTIAMRQTIWAKRNELGQSWFDKFGMVVLDEAHHASAETMFDLFQRFPAYYRYGCSATPDSDPDLFPIARAVIGPVVHETSLEEIGDHLVIPSVKVVKTEFEFLYRPTVRSGKKIIRNNYNSMIEDLEKDWKRNNIIVSQAVFQARMGFHVLIYSSRKNHLKILLGECESYCEYPPNSEIGIDLLIGDNSKEYNDIKKNIEEYNSNKKGTILFSTLVSEGTDIPCLDRLFLVYPGRKLRGFEQSIGRIMRPYPKKKDAIIYDFRDCKVPLLNSQYRTRAQGVYNTRGYKVEIIND